MTLYADVRAALRTVLLTVAGLPVERAWEAHEYTPIPGTSFLRDTLLPGFAERVSLGPFGRVRHHSLYQVDLMVPNRKGTVADAVADLVVAAFWPGLQMTYGGQVVTIRTSSRLSGLVSADGVWRQIPVSIDALTHTLNPA